MKRLVIAQTILSTALLIALLVHIFRTPDKIQAHRFELIDGNGETIATLGQDNGATMLRIFQSGSGGLVELRTSRGGAEIKASYGTTQSWLEAGSISRMILDEDGSFRAVGPNFYKESRPSEEGG